MRLKVLIVAVALLIPPRLQATGADTGTVPPVDLARLHGGDRGW